MKFHYLKNIFLLIYKFINAVPSKNGIYYDNLKAKKYDRIKAKILKMIVDTKTYNELFK